MRARGIEREERSLDKRESKERRVDRREREERSVE